MRLVVLASALAVAGGLGYAAGRVPTAGAAGDSRHARDGAGSHAVRRLPAVFEGAGHGFLRGQDASPANLAAAQQARPKPIAFFRAKLGAGR